MEGNCFYFAEVLGLNFVEVLGLDIRIENLSVALAQQWFFLVADLLQYFDEVFDVDVLDVVVVFVVVAVDDDDQAVLVHEQLVEEMRP